MIGNILLENQAIWGASAVASVPAAVLIYRSAALLFRWVFLRVLVAAVAAVALVGMSGYMAIWMRDHPGLCACAINPSGEKGPFHD